MIMSAFDTFIASINKFIPLSELEKDALLSVLTYKEFDKDEHLTRQGETENYLYFILEGCIRNYTLHDGEDYSLDFYFTGSFTNSYMSFLVREPSTVNVQALIPSKVIRIEYNDVQQLYARFKNFESLGRIVTESLYIRRTRREFSFITQSAQQRYLSLLSSHREIVQHIPQKYIASYLGIKAESLSRIRSALSRADKRSLRDLS
jgi:CRP/FNR family transcriptional regulator, anaerobic regulatory protein